MLKQDKKVHERHFGTKVELKKTRDRSMPLDRIFGADDIVNHRRYFVIHLHPACTEANIAYNQ